MSMAANIVLLASKEGEPDWISDTRYYSNPVDPSDPDDVAVDASGNVAVAVSGSPGFGIQSYDKNADLTNLRFNNGLPSSGGGTVSPSGKFVHYDNLTSKVLYTVPNASGSQAYNVFNLDASDGSLSTFAYGRDSNVNYGDGGYTIMTSGGGDSSGNFYGCGFTRQSGGNQYPYLVKYNSSAAVQWALVLQPQVATHTAPGVSNANFGTGQLMVSDSSGNTYVSLRHTTDSSDPGVFSYKLMKFNSSGVQQWVRVVNGPQYSGVSATDGTYFYSADTPSSSTLRVVATNASNGTIAWEKTLTFSGNTPAAKQIIASGGYIYVLSETSNGATNNTNNLGMTWIKMSTAGVVEWNKHIYASGNTYSTQFFNLAKRGVIAGSKIYTIFKGLGGVATVKLPLDGSKSGDVGKLPFISFGGAEPFTYNNYVSDINVDALTITASTTSTATSSSSTYGTTTTTMTTANVDVLSLGVTYDKAGIASSLAPLNQYNPVVAYSKRVLR